MKIIYQCEVCHARYDAAAKALMCEAQKLPDNIKVGDIVTKFDGYGWHNGSEAWIAKWHKGERRSADGKPNRDFYWLVIGINKGRNSGHGRHCNELIMISRGIVNGPSVDSKGKWGCFIANHYADAGYGQDFTVVDKPPEKVREEADEFIARGYKINDKDSLRVTNR